MQIMHANCKIMHGAEFVQNLCQNWSLVQIRHRSKTTQFKLHFRQLERKSCVFGVFNEFEILNGDLKCAQI